MTLGTAVNIHLKADSGVAAIAGTRIYPVRQPSSAVDSKSPTLIHFFGGLQDELDMGGGGFSRKTLICLCLAEAYDDSQALAEATITALRNYRGVMGGAGGVDVLHCIVSDVRDEEVPELAEAGMFLAVAEFEIAINI